MSKVFFITHPEVVIDPSVAVPEWHLSPIGRQEMIRFSQNPPWEDATLSAIWCSDEQKAKEAAEILSTYPVRPLPKVWDDLGEIDRRSTGYLPQNEFNIVTNLFFSSPYERVCGWPSAQSEQTRIIQAIEHVLASSPPGIIVIISHGGVGTLYLCHLKGVAICPSYDQPKQGCYYVFDRGTRSLLCGWTALNNQGKIKKYSS